MRRFPNTESRHPKRCRSRLRRRSDTFSQERRSHVQHGCACFVIERGTIAFEQRNGDKAQIVGTAGPGDFVGCMPLANAGSADETAAVASSDVVAFELDRRLLQKIIGDDPEIRARVASRAEITLLERLVRATTSFDAVPSAELRDLLRTVRRMDVSAGARIVVQDEAANDAYVVVSGRVEVVDEDTERALATLGRGALFGEAALLGNSTRNATVRAVEETSLLVLGRAPLLDLVSKNATVKARMMDLLNSRDRPKRSAGIEEHRQRGADGAPVVVLKNIAQRKFLRLSGDSLFVWERCDGATTIRDLATALFSERHRFAPATIVSVLAHLRAEGFLQPNVVFDPANHRTRALKRRGSRLDCKQNESSPRARISITWTRSSPQCSETRDPRFLRRPGAILIGLLSVAGIALFARSTA